MDKIMGLINWFTNKEHIEAIFAVLGAIYTLALTVVKLTPTPKDDELLDKVYGFFHRIAGSIGVKK